VQPETLGSRPGSIAADRDREVCGATHNWPSVVRVRGGVWPVGIFLSHCAPATPVAGAVHTIQVHSVSSDTLVRVGCALCGLVGLCFGGRMAFDLCLSRAHTGVVVMRQDSNY
jgi:hypothetical protein